MNGIIRTNISIWVVNERKNYSIVNRRRRKKKQSCGVPCCLCVRGERRESESGRTRRMKENRRGKSIGWMAKKEKADRMKVSLFRRRLWDGVPSHREEREIVVRLMAFRRALVKVDKKYFSPAAPPSALSAEARLLCDLLRASPSVNARLFKCR